MSWTNLVMSAQLLIAQAQDAGAQQEEARVYRQQMKRTIDEVLASPQFSDMEDSSSDWAHRVLEWFRSLFTGVGEAAGGLPAGVLWSLITICGLIILAILLHAVWTAVVSLRQSRSDVSLFAESQEPAGELLGIRELNAGDMARQARAHMAEARAEEALRYFYAAMILRLDEMRRLRYRPAKTNRDYLRELATDDAAYPAFDRITRAFEAAVYARRGAMLDDCRFADEALANLEREAAAS